MKTIINIGCNLGNITGVPFDKDFKDITLEDVLKIAEDTHGIKNLMIMGWCATPNDIQSYPLKFL